jgi:outer membrane protein OmpA-like peptidoglycan-associated protein
MVLMKKMSLVALTLLITVLPGCRDKKKESTPKTRKGSTERYIKTNVDISDEDDTQDMASDNDSLTDDEFDIDEDELDRILKEIDAQSDNQEDEDLEDNLLEDEALIPLEEEEEEENEDEDLDENELAWIDEQQDDELKKIYFTFNHYGVRADQKGSLAYDIEQVKQLVDQAGSTKPTIVFEGHADQEGSRLYNIGLSEMRAKNVADEFIKAGINKNIVKIVGRGQECPATINGKVVDGSRQERELNRRVEVRIIYT